MDQETMQLSEQVPVLEEVDICVLGGSCTGVFAAVRAARLGARVALVEKQGFFGGVSTITCTWNSIMDFDFKRQLSAGLTVEAVERLRRQEAVEVIERNVHRGFVFRPGDMKIVLDEMVLEAGVRPYLHTLFTAPVVREGELVGVAVSNKSGTGVIKARYFIDATGDGDLCHRLGLDSFVYADPLPPTTVAFLDHWPPPKGVGLGKAIAQHGPEFDLREGFDWGSVLPGTDIYMLAGTRVCHVDCADARQLTRAEMEGRRQVGAILKILRKYHPESRVTLQDFPASIGIRDSRHIRCQYQLSGEDVLHGRRFPDAIANGSYCVDVHHQDKPGITLMYLDGTSVYFRQGQAPVKSRWREERGEYPTFYQVPLRSLIPGRPGNLMLAGRMLDVDPIAFGAVRVMVNTNQMGEAAGVAAYLALSQQLPLARVDAQEVRALLRQGGAVVI